MTEAEPSPEPTTVRPTLGGHLAILRVDHWFKNVFVLPGVLVALGMAPDLLGAHLVPRFLLGMLAVCLIASSNYVLNEVIDAPFDRHHPEKRSRPVPSGRVSIPWAYVQWLVVMAAGLGLGALVSMELVAVLAVLWLMGCIYNVPPLRSKDRAYLDVVSESVNNPLRMLVGWFMVVPALDPLPPTTLLASYWMVGCYFMALKRYAELRQIGDAEVAAAYRRSFRWYTPERLLVSIMFYASSAMLFFGAFLMRYRLELILCFPLIAWVMAEYQRLAFQDDSPVQKPEGLYRQPVLMLAVGVCAAAILVLLFMDVNALREIFTKSRF